MILHAKSPTFWAAKLMGFTVLTGCSWFAVLYCALNRRGVDTESCAVINAVQSSYCCVVCFHHDRLFSMSFVSVSVLLSSSADSKMSKFQEGLQAQRQLVEQLRVEAGIHRMTVSESVAEIMKYMQQHADNDVLMKGFAKQSDNPFKEKGGCLIL